MERDGIHDEYEQAEDISTHALTWSATYGNRTAARRATPISTHALTWSATLGDVRKVLVVRNFNSRAHVERDIFVIPRFRPCFPFQLTRSRGARRATRRERWKWTIFQLTRSRGARQHITMWNLIVKNFNSRAHVERDPRCCCSRALAPHDTDPILFGLQNIGAMFINR